MKGIVKKMPFRWLGRFNGITIVPYIFVYKNAYADNPTRYAAFINHENIHVRQVEDEIRKAQKKCGKILGAAWGWVVWYAKYLSEFAGNVKKYKKAAYRNISYEREAYDNQYDLAYLDDREAFAVNDYKDE